MKPKTTLFKQIAPIFHKIKSFFNLGQKPSYSGAEPFTRENLSLKGDPVSNMAWPYIIIDTLVRQFGRAPYQNVINGEPVESGPVYDLFRTINPDMNQSALWQATSGWMFSEHEAFWWFGPDFGGIKMPTELYVIDPRRMYHYAENEKVIKWAYMREDGVNIPIMPDEIIHFQIWNRESKLRGRSPLASIILELITGQNITIEQAEHISARAIPPGILKSDQELSDKEIDQIQEIWESKYGKNKGRGKIAVLPSGTEFKPISDDLAKWIPIAEDLRLTFCAAFGVPPRVVGLNTKNTPLSGTDTEQEYIFLWNNTIVPMMNVIIETLKTQFYDRFRLREEPHFDWESLPEFAKQRLQNTESLVSLVNAGLKTANEIRAEVWGLKPLPWGNTWWHSLGLVPADGVPVTQEESKKLGIKNLNYDFFGNIPQKKKIPFFMKKTSPYGDRVKKRLTEIHNELIMKKESILAKKLKNEYFYLQRKALLDILLRDEKTIEDVRDFDWDEEADRLRFLVEPYIQDAYEFGQEEMTSLLDDFGIKPDFDIVEPRMLEEIEKSGSLITRITETERLAIIEILVDVVANGLSVQQAADKMRDYYKGFSASRSDTIARTELNGAANNARYIVMETSGVGYHEWAHSLAPNEREDHLETNGVVVLIGQLFQPANLTRPYDDAGTAEQIINCRCTTLPRPDYQEGI